MISFPPLDPALFTEETSAADRKAWLRAVVEAAERWLAANADFDGWFRTFQPWRDELLKQGWRTLVPADIRRHLHYIRFGSAARSEDLLGSDLDHAIITDGKVENETIIACLRNFIRSMNRLGLPPCQGFVMATNPRWMGTPAEWQQRIEQYFAFPDWKNTRYLFIMVDGLPLCPTPEPWTPLVTEVRERIRTSPFICWEMAHLGIHRSVAMDIRGHVRTQMQDGQAHLDIKSGLLNPLIHSIRLFAIREGVDALSTLQRLDALQTKQILSDSLLADIRAALYFAWRLRLLQHIRDLTNDLSPQDSIRWEHLSANEQAAMMVHLQTAKTLERIVHRTFRKPR